MVASRQAAVIVAARVIAIAGSLAVAAFIASTFTSDAPSCAPNRNAQLAARRPEWLASTLEATGIASSERVGLWPWQRHRPTATFELARSTADAVLTFTLGGLGVKGVVLMPDQHVKHLLSVQLAVAVLSVPVLLYIVVAPLPPHPRCSEVICR